MCWLQTGGEAVHKVSLHLVVPVDQVGDESRVALSVPTPLASTLKLKVPEKTAEGIVRDAGGCSGPAVGV